MTRETNRWPRPLEQLEPCHGCDGEGVLHWDGPPGRFDAIHGTWLPSEGSRVCPECNGEGSVLVRACPICGIDECSCVCTDDDTDAYYASLDPPQPQPRAA